MYNDDDKTIYIDNNPYEYNENLVSKKDFLKENGIVKLNRPPYYSEIEFEDGRSEVWHRGMKM